MPRGLQENFAQHKFPDPQLQFDESFPADPAHRALRKTLEKRFLAAKMEVEGCDINVRDFLSVMAGLMHTVRSAKKQPGLPQTCSDFMRVADEPLHRSYVGSIKEIWPAWSEAVIGPLAAHSRLDGELLAVTKRQDFTPQGKYVVVLRVTAEPAQCRDVTIDGATRPVVRVGSNYAWDGVSWLNWQDKPLYAQSHALRQLRCRVDWPATVPYLDAWLAESLHDPRIAECPGTTGRDLLVEYRICEQKIGYLVLSVLRDVAVVRTFLFLTMEGTPEGQMLRSRLRVSRREVDWLGLSELATFTQTDLRNDSVLRPILESCGCGHLFDLHKVAAIGAPPQAKPVAEEMRRFLRMAA